MGTVRALLRRTAGQDLIEYALLGTFVAFVAYVGAATLGVSVNRWFSAVSQVVDDGANKTGNVQREAANKQNQRTKKSNCGPRGIDASTGKCHPG